jgi:hypothetical protein
MATQNTIEQQLLDLLVTKNFEPAMKDKNGQDARQTDDAKLFSFDYVGDSGKNYGTMVIVLDQDNDLKIMYGDNLGRTMAGDDKDKFFDFIMQINQVANRNRWTHTATDLNKLKYVQQGLAAIQEGLFEGYYGTRRVSYSGAPTEARLMIKHNHVLGENDKRYRYVESLFIETADNERFKLGFKNLAAGRAMLEHVRQGGKPYDIRGNHITEMVNEIGVLSRFNRASQGRVMEGVTAELITEAQTYYKSLRESLKRLGSTRGYAAYFESWHPAAMEPQEGLVEDIKTMFIEQTLDTRIEAALPVLARLQQGKTMKEADIFENWANRLTEGTWQLPDTPETKQKLADLLVNELPVGPDATNALEQLDGVLGDDQLYDQLEALAQEDANADARDVIRARMEEMGLEVPGSEADAEVEPGAEPVPMEPAREQGVTEDKATYGPVTDAHKAASKKVFAAGVRDGKAGAEKNKQHMASALMKTTYLNGYKQGKQGVAEGSFYTPDSSYVTVNFLNSDSEGTPADLLAPYLKRQGFTLTDTINKPSAYRLKFASPAGNLHAQYGATTYGWRLSGSALESLDFDEIAHLFKGYVTRGGKIIADARQEDSELNEFAPGGGGGESGRWYTDDQMTDIVGDGWWQDLDISGEESKQGMIQEAQAWLLDNGYRVQVLNVKLNDDDCDWFIEGSFQNPGFAKKGMAESSSCNMTMEGDYCPEHGLMECGMHEGAFHNPEQTDSPAAQAITRRILLQRTDLLSKYGPEKVGQAIDEVADFIGDVEEIGSSDVSGWVRHVEQMLGNMGDDVAEAMRNTDDPYDDMVEDYLDYLESVGMLDKSREQEKAEILASLEAGHLHSSEIEYALSGTKWDPLAPHGMAEANDDPINYNGAITGSYYESKQDPLARIKSLALRK